MHKRTRTVLRIIGVVLLLIGLIAAYYGPLEIYVFYLFSKGGRFHYEGFGVGSFWFAALVVQNLGYYSVAALFIPLGIGHLRLRRWAITLTQLSLWFWLGAGILLVVNFSTLLPGALKLEINREVLFFRLGIIGLSALNLLILAPLLALLLYRSAIVRSVFTEHDSNHYWVDRYPSPLLALLGLYVILIIGMHIAIFLQSIFPFFGRIILGRQSVYLVALCILIMGILIYGTVRLKRWAWWGSLAFISGLTISTVATFSRYRFYDLILMMNLPPFEMAFIDQLTLLHDFRLAGLLAGPLLIALGLIAYSTRYFRNHEPSPQSPVR